MITAFTKRLPPSEKPENDSSEPNKKAWKVSFLAIAAVSLAPKMFRKRQPMVALRLDSGGPRQVISQPRRSPDQKV